MSAARRTFPPLKSQGVSLYLIPDIVKNFCLSLLLP